MLSPPALMLSTVIGTAPDAIGETCTIRKSPRSAGTRTRQSVAGGESGYCVLPILNSLPFGDTTIVLSSGATRNDQPAADGWMIALVFKCGSSAGAPTALSTQTSTRTRNDVTMCMMCEPPNSLSQPQY